MSSDEELSRIVQEVLDLELSLAKSPAEEKRSGDDAALVKRLALEAKALLDHELGMLNDFSTHLLLASAGSSAGLSLSTVKAVRAVIEGGLNQVRRKPTQALAKAGATEPTYVSPSRLAELRALTAAPWDIRRLVRLVEELNTAHMHRSHMSVAMLVRAIADHVPPVFNYKTFAEVANNHPGSKSFRGSMQNLQGSLRNIADAHLHVQIRRSETLPTEAQVDFRADVDVLLGELVRVLR